MPDVVGVAHMVLRVRDWKQSARWYQDVLGFERHKGEGFSVFRHPAAGFGILLLPTDVEDLDPSSAASQRIDHLALQVPDVEALESWRAALAAKGLEVKVDEVPTIGSSITLHDPDGLEIELFVPAAGSLLGGG